MIDSLCIIWNVEKSGCAYGRLPFKSSATAPISLAIATEPGARVQALHPCNDCDDKDKSMKLALGMAIAAAASLSACATTTTSGPVEVTRFHLGSVAAPLETGTLAVEPAPGGGPASLEFKTYAAAVQTEALAHGFTVPKTDPDAQYLAVVGFTRTTRPAAPRSGGSGVSIGLGGGGYSGGGYRGGGGGVGLGGGISFPIGKQKYRTMVLTDLTVQIRRRRDATVIWEGHAQTFSPGEAPAAQANAAAAKLSHALFLDFPGESGRTITVR
jgi:hypothetical protein